MMILVSQVRGLDVHGLMCSNEVDVRPRLYVEYQVGRFCCFALRFFEVVGPRLEASLLSCSFADAGSLRVPVPVPLVELVLVDAP